MNLPNAINNIIREYVEGDFLKMSKDEIIEFLISDDKNNFKLDCSGWVFPIDMAGMDMSRTNLVGFESDIYLNNVNMSGVNLKGSNLSGVHLIGANLSGANLTGANMSGVDLIGANLNGANLSDSDMKKVFPL